MKALDSHYIIDGREMEATPREILSAVCQNADVPDPAVPCEDIIDESADPQPSNDHFEPQLAKSYAQAVASTERLSFPLCYSGSLSRLAVARCLLKTLFRRGRFKLGDLRPDAAWTWDSSSVGSMAAFYESVEWACEYMDSLGIKLHGYTFRHSQVNKLELFCSNVEKTSLDEAVFEDSPFSSPNAVIDEGLMASPAALPSSGDWILYIPFDTCKYRLGGSLLSMATGKNGGKSPDITDADYFIDCYEVVRELVEDGIAVAGNIVADGGLYTALYKFVDGKSFTADIASVARASEEDDITKLLFGEIPGVLIQIKDCDFDYVDAELLLQDVAYYPLGQVTDAEGALKLDTTGDALKGILISLLGNASEGED